MEDDFEVYGPNHMRSKAGVESKIVIDWENDVHRRCIASCLVKGTCVMENDRNLCRLDDDALAPAWWKSFGFKRVRPFKNDSKKYDQFTYGAIFKLMGPSPPHPSAPEYVVAFRGTMLHHPKAMEDLKQDFWVLLNVVADFKRFKRTYWEVDSLVGDRAGSVWLAGHSLGASMAQAIGRNLMFDKGRIVPTFLFNPPHVSLAPVINEVLTEEQKTALYILSFMAKFVLTNLLPRYHKRTKQLFEQLAPWVPDLYVNPDDFICQGYIDYFGQRQQVGKDHPGLAKTAARASYRDIIFSMFSDKSQPHLLPSARLWTSSTPKKEAHRLQQWWKTDGELKLSLLFDAAGRSAV